MSKSFLLNIQREIPSQNVLQWSHWRKVAAERKAMGIAVLVAVAGARIRKGVLPGRRRIEITAFRKRRITDKANLIGGAKQLVDALVHEGILRDDSDTWADITYSQRLASETPDRRPCTIVQVTDI